MIWSAIDNDIQQEKDKRERQNTSQGGTGELKGSCRAQSWKNELDTV